jgi:hypothetical protein
VIATTFFLPVTALAGDRPLRTYFVGNSVTDTIRYGSLAKLAGSRGHTLTWGRDMIPGAPLSWLWQHPDDGFREDRRLHLERDLAFSDLTAELYRRYRRHIGWWRYETLLRVQSVLVPEHVRRLLGLEPCRWPWPWLRAYRTMVRVGLRPLVQ